MKRLVCCALAACVLFSLLLTACASQAEKTKYSAYSLDYFDTATTVTGYAEDQEAFDAIADAILAQLGEYHKLYTIYHRYDGLENLCTINELVDGAHRTVTVDRRIIDLLLYAKQMYTATDGLVNVAMGSVLSLWHDYRTLGKDDPSTAALPPMDGLRAAADHVDIEALVIDEQNSTVTLTDPKATLDVGAIAKGYATERVALWMQEQGYDGFVLNVGGNVRTVGAKSGGTPWTVGIEDPNGGEYLAYLQLNGQSVVTSGSYQRYYIVDGKRYHHIIHPDTLMPSEGYLSVSVVCGHSGLGDALSTALFCLPQAEGLALVESMPDVEALWVTEDGARIVSSGWNAYVKE